LASLVERACAGGAGSEPERTRATTVGVEEQTGGGDTIPCAHRNLSPTNAVCDRAAVRKSTRVAACGGSGAKTSDASFCFRASRVQGVSLYRPIVSALNLRLHIATPPCEGRCSDSLALVLSICTGAHLDKHGVHGLVETEFAGLDVVGEEL
jgi:hypothetical protein